LGTHYFNRTSNNCGYDATGIDVSRQSLWKDIFTYGPIGTKMIDKFFYNMFGRLDNAISFVETYAIKTTTWCWHSRVKLLKKRRSKK
jgi:hypothetical protein